MPPKRRGADLAAFRSFGHHVVLSPVTKWRYWGGMGTLMRRESIDFFGHGRRRLALADCDVMGVEGVMHATVT